MSKVTSTGLAERGIGLGFDFLKAIIDDPSIADDIPNGATVVLLPDDDTELAESSLQGGIEAARKGADVYIRHFKRSEDASVASDQPNDHPSL